MPPFIRLSIMPAVGLLFLAAAFLWCERELTLRLLGRPAEGRIIGMALQRADHADLLTTVQTDLVFTLANGDRITTSHTDYTPQRASYQTADGSPARVLDLADSGLPPELDRTLSDTVRGEVAIVRWALQREGRRNGDPQRVLRIEKTETVRGYFGVPSLPDVLGLKDGRLLLNADGSASALAGLVRIHAVFDRTDEARLKTEKGDSLIAYAYEKNGVAVTPEKKNFFLQAEPYATEFRPVFAFTANGLEVARLSHIGRQGGPTLALRLYEPCRVYYDPANPEQAVVTAVPGPVAGAPLDWFSRLCEGIFAQWGSAALIALAGLLFIGTGLLFASLALWPSRKIASH